MSELFWWVCGALSSLIISGFFFFLSKKRKRISQDINTFRLVSNKVSKIEGLEVKYKSKGIENLFSSVVTIRNIGNSTIENFDFAPSFPLSIITTGRFLIDKPKGIDFSSTNKSNNIHPFYEFDDQNMCNRITIAFDYISKREKLTITILHTEEISVGGILKDGKILDQNKIMRRKNFLINVVLGIVSALMGVLSYNLATLFFSHQ